MNGPSNDQSRNTSRAGEASIFLAARNSGKVFQGPWRKSGSSKSSFQGCMNFLQCTPGMPAQYSLWRAVKVPIPLSQLQNVWANLLFDKFAVLWTLVMKDFLGTLAFISVLSMKPPGHLDRLKAMHHYISIIFLHCFNRRKFSLAKCWSDGITAQTLSQTLRLSPRMMASTDVFVQILAPTPPMLAYSSSFVIDNMIFIMASDGQGVMQVGCHKCSCFRH